MKKIGMEISVNIEELDETQKKSFHELMDTLNEIPFHISATACMHYLVYQDIKNGLDVKNSYDETKKNAMEAIQKMMREGRT